MTALPALALLPLGSVALATAAGWALCRWPRAQRWAAWEPAWLDLVLVGAVAALGLGEAIAMHTLANPAWVPMGQDWHDFVLRAGELVSRPHTIQPIANRYPLYPLMGVLWARTVGIDDFQGLMAVSIFAAGLLPAALFLLGRQLAPWPVALAGALPCLRIPVLIAMLGPPTIYVPYALVQVLAMAAGIAALRRGGAWRFLAFGVALALLMGLDAKALVVLGTGVPAGLVAIAWHARRRGWRSVLALAALGAPLALVWVGCGRLGVPIQSLEYLVANSLVQHAATDGATLQMHPRYGSTLSPREWAELHGTWRVGQAGALSGLPRTVRFLADGTRGNLPRARRLDDARRGIGDQIPLPPAWLGACALACLAAGSRRERGESPLDHRVGWALAAGFCALLVAVEVAGMVSTTWEARYALTFLCLAPALFLAGLAAVPRIVAAPAWREASLPWIPLLLLAGAWWVGGAGPLGGARARDEARALAEERATNSYSQLWQLRALRGDPGVVDLSGTWLTQLVLGHARLVDPPGSVGGAVALGGLPDARRFVVQPCMFDNARGRWVAPEPGRLEAFAGSPCIDEDLAPDAPLTLAWAGEGRPPVAPVGTGAGRPWGPLSAILPGWRP